MDIRRLPISPVLPGLLALLLGLSATATLYLWTRSQERANEQLLFERRAGFRVQTIRQGLDDVMEALDMVNRVVVTFHPVSREQFVGFTDPVLQRHPFINAISFLRIVPGAQRVAYERDIRRRLPRFVISEFIDGKIRPAPPRPEYLVAEIMAPQHDWDPLLGFNATSEPAIARTLERARDTGLAASTGLFRHASDQSQPLRLVIVKPVFRAGAPTTTTPERRAALIGYTSVGMPAEMLVERILSDAQLLPAPGLHLAVHVGASGTPQNLVYRDAENFPSAGKPDWLAWLPGPATLRFVQSFELAGVPWTVQATQDAPSAIGLESGSLLVAVFGTLLSLLATGYLRLLGTRTVRIQSLVRERTAALHAANSRLSADIDVRERIEATLRRTQQSLTNAQRIAHVGSWELDIDSGVQYWSEECFRIFGLQYDASAVPALGQLPQATLIAWRQALSCLVAGIASAGIECRILRADGSERHLQVHGEILPETAGQTPMLAGTVLDISDFKRVETELRQSQASLRDLASHQERIKESERKRIAREIHDELGGLLTGIKAYVSVAADKTRGKPAEALLSEAASLADTALDTVRRVISDLRPSVLDQLGVWEAIAWQASQVEAQTGIPCRCVLDPELPSVDGDDGAMLFRIVQEALTNIARHAQATSVEIRAWQAGRQLVLEVEDDGVGFGAEAEDAGPSWGLRGMEERARYLDGTLAFCARPEGGTLIRLAMPAPASRELTET
ncbi:sensor histidine kinase [Noviherbaspirillum pedocola]|uniref:CHASE domain-containing protein n=1 Tax=Noviherbaspirillum pedocola TaxID=2801341 RepID=A0A934SZB7_9BURK|nr:CHASE domain-containing protein [Noviherbaspirillum pedocola]MBK4735752.1 CHASE domain-containing protein [Noviherbaspirillum pedocola]